MTPAPIPGSRAGRRFLLGVAVFLAVTAGLKLYSGLLETKVLGTADPLLPFFTVRQMMFLAALLELAVAFVLFRRQHAEAAPWLVLWLVGVFAAYRVGLWAVGFQGHCSCLGHVLDFLPDVWLDRLMVASLGVMALGSVGCIASRRHPALFGRIRADVGVTTAVLLSAVSGTLEAHAGDVPPLAITAQYRRESFRPGSTDPIRSMELRITIYSSNRWWRIRTDPLETGLLPVDWMRIPDGLRSHSDSAAHVAAARPEVTNWFPSAEAYPGTYPLRGDTGLLLAWLAYVPRPELPTLDGRRIRRFLTADLAADKRNEGTFGLEWLAPEKAFLARLSITNNGVRFTHDGGTLRQNGNLSAGWLEFEYGVSTTTNVLGVAIPVLGILRHLWAPPDARSAAELQPFCVETVRLVDARPLTMQGLPSIAPVVLALDYRLPGLPRGRSVNYHVTNDVWKPLTDPELRSLAMVEWHLNKRKPSLLRIGFGAVLVILVLSPATLLLIRRSKHSNNRQDKQAKEQRTP